MKTFLILALLIISIYAHGSHDDHDSHQDHQQESDLTKAQIWGFGILTGICVSLLGFIAAIVLVLSKKYCKESVFKHIIKFMFSLAFGALIGDAVVHILSEAFSDESINGNIASLIFICSILIFLFIDRLLHAYGVAHTHWVQESRSEHSHSHQGGQDNNGDNPQQGSSKKITNQVNSLILVDLIQQSQSIVQPLQPAKTPSPKSNLPENNQNKGDQPSESKQTNADFKSKFKLCFQNLKGKQSSGYMNLIGSFIHNFIDGLAIGVTYATGQRAEIIPVVIAIVAHEIPRELGDVAILLKSRFSSIQTILCNGTINFLSLIGVIIGLSVADLDEIAQTYIMVSVAGNFIYIAADIWQNLFKNLGEGAKLQNFIQFIGAAVGIGAMFGIKYIQE